MKKRIRKKLHLKEFAVYGFDLHLVPVNEDEDTVLEILNGMCGFLEENGWKCGWECGGPFGEFFIYEGRPGTGIAEKQEAFLRAMKQIPSVTEVCVGEIVDAWDGNDAHACQCGCEEEEESCHCGCHHEEGGEESCHCGCHHEEGGEESCHCGCHHEE